MLTQILALSAGAAFSGAFGFPKPVCYVAAFVAAILACLFRYYSKF